MSEHMKALLFGAVVAFSFVAGAVLTRNALVDLSQATQSSVYGLHSPAEQNLERQIRASQLIPLLEQLTRLSQSGVRMRSRAGFIHGDSSWDGNWESMLGVTVDLLEHCQAVDKQREETTTAWTAVADSAWSLQRDTTVFRKEVCGR